MNKQGIGLVVAGNELNKVDTIKSLAKTVATSHDVIGQVVGDGMLANADAIANSPAYQEAVEVLALYLQTMVQEKTKENPFTPLPDDEDEDEDTEDENDDENDDEDEDEEVCSRCGIVLDNDTDDADCVNGELVCYDCMTASEYRDIT
jgi:hypothetical protein